MNNITNLFPSVGPLQGSTTRGSILLFLSLNFSFLCSNFSCKAEPSPPEVVVFVVFVVIFGAGGGGGAAGGDGGGGGEGEESVLFSSIVWWSPKIFEKEKKFPSSFVTAKN